MIPKKIHYCWFGGGPLPTDVKKCIDSWRKFCPEYEIIRWDESNFIISDQNNFVQAAYENKAWAFVSDYARLRIIYENGGIYLDTDVELIRNLDELLDHVAFFGAHQVNGLVATGLGFGSEKRTKILKELLRLYDNTDFDPCKKNELACPILNSFVFTDFGYQPSSNIVQTEYFTIYPAEYFDPIYVGANARNLLSEKTYSIHHYSASWTPVRVRIKNKIIRYIGRDKILQLKKILERKR